MVYLLVARSGLDGQQLGNSNVASAVWGKRFIFLPFFLVKLKLKVSEMNWCKKIYHKVLTYIHVQNFEKKMIMCAM